MGLKLRMKAVVQRTGWHPNTIRRAIKRGRLPATQTPGGQYRVDEDALKKAMTVDPPK